jgi:hypothetical protein
MGKRIFAAIAMAAAMTVSSAANAAVTINFDGYAPLSFNSTLLTQGFKFETSGGFLTPGPADADPTGSAMAALLPGATVRVSLIDGGTFDVLSLAMADRLNIGAGGPVDFLFSNGNSLTRNINFSSGLQTFALGPQTGLSWFEFRARPASLLAGFAQFDNLVVDNITAAVPEPATWAMMILGFFGLGTMVRRSRRQGAPAAA